MTEHPLFHGAPFPPEVISAMATVFDEVSRERGLAPPAKTRSASLLHGQSRIVLRVGDTIQRRSACAYNALGLR